MEEIRQAWLELLAVGESPETPGGNPVEPSEILGSICQAITELQQSVRLLEAGKKPPSRKASRTAKSGRKPAPKKQVPKRRKA